MRLKYGNSGSSWIVKNEIEKLARHISESFTKSNNCNSLWKYFSLKSIATPPEKLGGDAEKIDYLTMQVDAIRQQLNESSERKSEESTLDLFSKTVNKKLKENIIKGFSQENEVPSFVEGLTNLLAKYQTTALDLNLKIQRNFEGNRILVFPYKSLETFPLEAFKELHIFLDSCGVQLQVK